MHKKPLPCGSSVELSNKLVVMIDCFNQMLVTPKPIVSSRIERRDNELSEDGAT